MLYIYIAQETLEERRQLISEQDTAYEESLQIDQAKVSVWMDPVWFVFMDVH